MARKAKRLDVLPTIWNASDDLWAAVAAVLAVHDPPARFGPERIDQRKAFDGVIYRMRSGVQWNRLPKDFGDDASVHRTFQRWVKRGVLPRVWAVLVEGCDEMGGVDWKWQSFDCAMGKARHGGDEVGPNPTDRAKNGTKRGVLTEAEGGPIGIVIAPANRHDSLLLQDALEAVIVEPPDPLRHEQHLCLDKAFDGAPSEATAMVFGYEPHIRRIGEEKKDRQGRKRHKARRYVVERTISWLNRCRGILVRYEKKAENYLAVVQLACALLWFRRMYRLTT